MHVFMMTHDDVIDKQTLLVTPVWERWPYWNLFWRLSKTDYRKHLLTRVSMNGDNVRFEAVVKNNAWRTYWTCFQIIWTILLCISLPLDLLLYDTVGFRIFYVLQGSVATY